MHCLHLFLYQYLLPYTVFYLALLVSDFVIFVAKICFNLVDVFLMEIFTFTLSTAAVGISFMQFANNNSLRNFYILGLSLFLGISIPQYFVMNTDMTTGHGPIRTGGGWVSFVHYMPLCFSLNFFLHINASMFFISLNFSQHLIEGKSIR